MNLNCSAHHERFITFIAQLNLIAAKVKNNINHELLFWELKDDLKDKNRKLGRVFAGNSQGFRSEKIEFALCWNDRHWRIEREAGGDSKAEEEALVSELESLISGLQKR